jgi:cell division transport system permease protein
MNAWLPASRRAGAGLSPLAGDAAQYLLSLLVIGIALTLPAFGYVALDNLRDLGATPPACSRSACS